MNVPFIIAKRYFFSKSKQNLINVINAIALTVVVVATASLFVVLSAFSGLKSFGLSFTSAFDPDYRVETTTGKILHLDSLALQQLREEEGVLGLYPVLEEKVFLNFKEKSQVAFLKGVDTPILLLFSPPWFPDNGLTLILTSLFSVGELHQISVLGCMTILLF